MANQAQYGFRTLLDVFPQPVVENLEAVNTAVQATLVEHNRQVDSIVALFADPVDKVKEKYKVPANYRLQGLDEMGRALPVKGGSDYTVEYPLKRAGAASGLTYDAAQKMTVGQLNDEFAQMLTADRRWVRDQILGALFANTSWVANNEEDGDQTILGLANGDTVKYLIQVGHDEGATDNHYLAQASAIDNSNDPFPGIYSEIKEHPENTGDVIALIPTNLKDTTMALSAFTPVSDPKIRQGANTAELIAALGTNVPGQVIGYHTDRVWLVEWPSLPSNYIVGVTQGGSRPLGMRQEKLASLRGFRMVGERNDHPYFEKQYLRTLGFGGRNRVGATVTRVGNGTYAVPTGYAQHGV